MEDNRKPKSPELENEISYGAEVSIVIKHPDHETAKKIARWLEDQLLEIHIHRGLLIDQAYDLDDPKPEPTLISAGASVSIQWCSFP